MIKLTLAAAALSLAAFAAEVPLISLVPTQATVIGGIHVDKTAASPFGAFILSQVNEGDQDFREMIAATGFDPRRDLRELVFASAGQAKGPGLVLARGVFNGPQILAAVKAKTNGTVTNYNGVDVLEHAQRKGTGALAFVDGSLAIAGDSALVRAALDRRSGSPAAAPLSGKATAASNLYDAWIVTSGTYHPAANAVPGGTRSPGIGTAATAALQSVLETSGGLTFGSVVRFGGEALARSEKDAQALVDVAKFAASLIQLNGQNNPDLLKLQPVLDSLSVKAEGAVVRFSAAINESDLENLMHSRKSVRTASAR